MKSVSGVAARLRSEWKTAKVQEESGDLSITLRGADEAGYEATLQEMRELLDADEGIRKYETLAVIGVNGVDNYFCFYDFEFYTQG